MVNGLNNNFSSNGTQSSQGAAGQNASPAAAQNGNSSAGTRGLSQGNAAQPGSQPAGTSSEGGTRGVQGAAEAAAGAAASQAAGQGAAAAAAPAAQAGAAATPGSTAAQPQGNGALKTRPFGGNRTQELLLRSRDSVGLPNPEIKAPQNLSGAINDATPGQALQKLGNGLQEASERSGLTQFLAPTAQALKDTTGPVANAFDRVGTAAQNITAPLAKLGAGGRFLAAQGQAAAGLGRFVKENINATTDAITSPAQTLQNLGKVADQPSLLKDAAVKDFQETREKHGLVGAVTKAGADVATLFGTGGGGAATKAAALTARAGNAIKAGAKEGSLASRLGNGVNRVAAGLAAPGEALNKGAREAAQRQASAWADALGNTAAGAQANRLAGQANDALGILRNGDKAIHMDKLNDPAVLKAAKDIDASARPLNLPDSARQALEGKPLEGRSEILSKLPELVKDGKLSPQDARGVVEGLFNNGSLKDTAMLGQLKAGTDLQRVHSSTAGAQNFLKKEGLVDNGSSAQKGAFTTFPGQNSTRQEAAGNSALPLENRADQISNVRLNEPAMALLTNAAPAPHLGGVKATGGGLQVLLPWQAVESASFSAPQALGNSFGANAVNSLTAAPALQLLQDQ